MKKTCTASNCRKTFSYTTNMAVSCPFCGKSYPRLGNPAQKYICVIDGHSYNMARFVKNLNYYKTYKVQLIKEIRSLTGLSLYASKQIGDALTMNDTLVTRASTYFDGLNRLKLHVHTSKTI